MKPSFAQPKNISEDQTSNPIFFLKQPTVYTTNIRDINIAGEDMIQGSTLFLNLNDEGVTPGFVRIPNLIWFQYLRARLSTSPWQGQFHLIW